MRYSTIQHAHQITIRDIMNSHFTRITEDGEVTIEYPEPMVITVEHPTEESMIYEEVGYNRKYMEQYAQGILYRSDIGFVYTYGNRFRDWGKNHVNQISYVIDKLTTDLNTRRAILHTWDNDLDLSQKDVPCLQDVQFLSKPQRDGTTTLDIVAYFRSNDMLMAWGCNAYGLTKLLEYIIMTTQNPKLKPGTLTTISASAHIYIRRDESVLRRLGYNVDLYY